MLSERERSLSEKGTEDPLACEGLVSGDDHQTLGSLTGHLLDHREKFREERPPVSFLTMSRSVGLCPALLRAALPTELVSGSASFQETSFAR